MLVSLLSTCLEAKVYETGPRRGSPRKSQALDTPLTPAPKWGCAIKGQAHGTEGTERSGPGQGQRTYLHGDPLCPQGSPGAKEAQCRQQEGVHGSSAEETGVAGLDAREKQWDF